MVDLKAFALMLDPQRQSEEFSFLRLRTVRRPLKRVRAMVIIEPWLTEVWDSFLWMILSLPALKMSYDISKKHERDKAIALVVFMCRKVERAFWHPTRLIGETKAACLAARRFSLSGAHEVPSAIWQLFPKALGYNPSRRSLMQASMLARALPRKSEVGAAVAKQITDLTTPSAVLDHADYLHLKTYAKRVFGRINPIPRANLNSRSASYSRSRKHGGKGQELLDVINNMEAYDRLPTHEGYGREGSGLNIKSKFYHTYGPLLAAREYHMDSRAIPILERGWKVRMVSCSDPIRSLRSESYRQVLYPKLKRLEACRTALMGEPTKLTFRNVVRQAIVYSADLSAATDKLSWGAINALSEGLGIPFDLVAGGTLEGVEMTRGTLMGIPLSWPFLSIIHNWAIERMGISKGSYHLKGDDLIALWCLEEIAYYEHHLPLLTGMELNHKKTLLGPRHGVFCERFFVRTKSVHQNEWTLNLMTEVFSLRPFTGMNDPGYPPEIALMEYLWSLEGRVSWNKIRRLSKVWESKHLPPYIRGLGDIVTLPPYMGGLSLIPRDPGARVSPWLGRIATLIHNGRGDAIVRQLRLNLKGYVGPDTVEAKAAKCMEALENVISLRVEGHLPALEYYLSHKLDLELFWARLQGASPGNISFKRYVSVLSSFMRKRGKPLGSNCAALEWTYGGVRKLMARLGPAAIDLSKAAPAEREWFTGLLANDHKDLPTLLRGDPRVSVGFNLHLRSTII